MVSIIYNFFGLFTNSLGGARRQIATGGAGLSAVVGRHRTAAIHGPSYSPPSLAHGSISTTTLIIVSPVSSNIFVHE